MLEHPPLDTRGHPSPKHLRGPGQTPGLLDPGRWLGCIPHCQHLRRPQLPWQDWGFLGVLG